MEVSSAAQTTLPMTAETTAATTTPATPATSTSGFDWKGVGLDDAALNVVNERQWKNPADLFTSYRNLEKLTGVPAERLVKIPKDNDPAAWNDAYAKLGRPETADKYVIKVPEGDTGEFAGVVKAWFHDAGISQAQATKLSEKWNGYIADAQKAAQTQRDQTNQIQVTELKSAWGADYDAKTALVDRAAETFGMTQEQLSALKTTMGPKAAMQFLHNIGAKIAVEDRTVPGLGGTTSFGMTPDQAKALIAEKRNSREFSQLFSSQDPKQRMEAREEMTRLHKIAYPGMTDYAPGSAARS